MSPQTNSLGIEDDPKAAGAHFTWRKLLASPGLPASLLCWAGSILLIVSALIHYHLWASVGYRGIPTIGPLFLLQVIAGIATAIAVAISRYFLVALAGALFAAGTIAGFVYSVQFGLFGFKDTYSATDGTASLVVEAAAFVVLVAAALLGRRATTSRAH